MVRQILSFLGRSVVVSSLLCAGACGAGSAPPPAAPKSAAKGAEKKPLGARERLMALLREIPRGADPLSLLDPALRKELDATMSRLGERERTELGRLGGPFARERPLLHLAAGGTSPEALYQLATTPRLAGDLLAVRAASGGTDVSDLPTAVRKLSEGAALRWLHDRAVDTATPSAIELETLDQIDEVAQTIDRWDIVRLARELASARSPEDPHRFVALARASAHELDPAAARQALERAERLARGDQKLSARIENARRWLRAAETVRATRDSATTREARLRLARAYLDLLRFEDAKRVLAPERGARASHLGLAAALADAELGGTLCPGLPPGLGTTLLCASAWTKDARVAPAVQALEAAWKSGAGRDDRSVESYLALAHVAPWMYGAMMEGGTGTPEARQQRFAERLGKMQEAARDAARQSPRFRGAVLFAEAIGVGFRAATTSGAKVGDADREKLVSDAIALRKEVPPDPLVNAGVLAVAALSFRDRDVSNLLALLPEKLDAKNDLALRVLLLWVAATKKNEELLRFSSGQLAEALPELGADALERARLVLLLAESDASVSGSEKAYSVLERVARPLLGEEVPLELRLRAAIDVAGALARAGKPGEGASVLERVVSGASVTQSDEKNLGLVAASYLFVLRAREAKGKERVEYRDKLAALDKEPIGQNAPNATVLWRELWLRELQFRIEEDRCGALGPCLARAEKKRKAPTRDLDQKAGPEVAKLIRRGALPAGSLSLTFSFGAAGLEALVSVSPALLAVEAPPGG